MPNRFRAGNLVVTDSTNQRRTSMSAPAPAAQLIDHSPSSRPVERLGLRLDEEVECDVRCDADQMVRSCLIVDDNEQFLAVAHASLEREGLEVVGTANTIAEALAKVDVLHPDVVIVDIALGQESGFELTRQIVASHPELRAHIVLISTRREEDFADLITASPAAGFLAKSQLSARAVRELVAGR
jgi:CheY-like chemotaxis protein